MPSAYIPLPADDESVDALMEDFKDYLRAAIPGWEPSDGAVEVAVGGAFADEASTLYSLLRERAADELRDFGADILGVFPAEPVPASTTTTWTARDDDGYTIDAGTVIVIDAPAGRFAFEVVTDTTIDPVDTVVAGVLVQAVDAGAGANLATGPVLFDEPPAWVETVTVDAAATGGSDGETDDQYLSRIRRAAQLLNRAPILPRDFELAAQEIPEVARALVRNLYDDTTGLSDQERTVSIYPVTAAGTVCSAGGKAAVVALIEARREVNWVVRVADPTYTEVDVAITVAAEDGVDQADLADRVEAAIAERALNPALWGQPPFGERSSWRQRTTVRRYEVASVADSVDGVEYVEAPVELNGADADVVLSGAAPLPLPGTVTVTVVDAT